MLSSRLANLQLLFGDTLVRTGNTHNLIPQPSWNFAGLESFIQARKSKRSGFSKNWMSSSLRKILFYPPRKQHEVPARDGDGPGNGRTTTMGHRTSGDDEQVQVWIFSYLSQMRAVDRMSGKDCQLHGVMGHGVF
jgi:hypothetical protein